MEKLTTKTYSEEKLVIKLCHACTRITESQTEPERCSHCSKAFLPLNYFEKIHDAKGENYQKLFASSSQLDEEDLIKGLYVIW